MDDDRSRLRAIQDLLVRTEQAHGAYETAELGGVYDREWARWYAAFAVDNGIGNLVGRDVSVDELATILSEGFASFTAADPPPADGWAANLAERVASELEPPAA